MIYPAHIHCVSKNTPNIIDCNLNKNYPFY